MSLKDMIVDGAEESAHLFLFAHGAGAGMDSPYMSVVAQGVAGQGVRVVRFEFPYMAQRRRAGTRRPPDKADRLADAYLAAVESMPSGPALFIGGKSMGGRIATMIADGCDAKGVICFGYPFHPPGRPERHRTAHLRTLVTPTLILQGTRDPMGRLDEASGYELSSSIEIRWFEDGDHDLKPRKRPGFDHEVHLKNAITAAVDFMRAT